MVALLVIIEKKHVDARDRVDQLLLFSNYFHIVVGDGHQPYSRASYTYEKTLEHFCHRMDYPDCGLS